MTAHQFNYALMCQVAKFIGNNKQPFELYNLFCFLLLLFIITMIILIFIHTTTTNNNNVLI